MKHDARIEVHHLTRVEGHGNITAEIRDGELCQVRFEIIEAPRFFELFLRGHKYDEVVHMASRICGICAVSHKSAALKATEAAFGVEVSTQTKLLRRLAYHGEVLSSHILHIYFLAAPDFLGVPSAFHVADSQREVVVRGMRFKKLGYDLCELVAGRHTHPVAMVVGGFSFVHDTRSLDAMRKRLQEAKKDIEDTVALFSGIKIPDFPRETEYISLRSGERYAFYDGDVHSSRGDTVSPQDYDSWIEEYTVPYSTAKLSRRQGQHYMVGALARFNNNYPQLSPLARQAAMDLPLPFPTTNPFAVTLAQIVECAHCVEESLKIIEELLHRGIEADAEQAAVNARAGRGVGAVEAPRGILFHEYEFDDEGICRHANLVIPTAQNLGNIEDDMQSLAPQIAGRDKEEITHSLEMLARAYDPCISCSVHVVKKDHT